MHVHGVLLALAVASSPVAQGEAPAGAPPSSAGRWFEGHLAAGARAFREGQYDEALVEFRVAQELGAPDAAPYAAAALVKLGRPEDAVEAFAAIDEGRDTLLDYYRGVACYQARLYLCADRLFVSVGARAGPRIAAEVARARRAIASELAKEPPRPSIDWYLTLCGERREGGRPALAAAFCEEAAGLAGRRADRYRLGEATTQLAKLGTGGRRPAVPLLPGQGGGTPR